jgi:hypothetical protein
MVRWTDDRLPRNPSEKLSRVVKCLIPVAVPVERPVDLASRPHGGSEASQIISYHGKVLSHN